MLANLLGVRLIFWAGPVPVPTSSALLQAIERIEVERSGDALGGFQITLVADKSVGTEFDLLSNPQLTIGSRVVLGVFMGVTPEWLCDGVITHRELQPSDRPGSSRLIVTGRDLGTLLDRLDIVLNYPGCADSVIATTILARYVGLGIVPLVTPTTDVPLPTERIPLQRETDLRCLQRLAADNNYVFFIEPLGYGSNRAYFGPDSRLSLPLLPLRVDMGTQTNVEALSFKQDGDKPELVEARAYPPGSIVAMPLFGAPTVPLPPLAAVPNLPLRTRFAADLTSRSLPRALSAATSMQARALLKSVEGSGSLDTVRYGSVLQPRRPIGVIGAGYSFDGYYSVAKVRHETRPRPVTSWR